MPEVLGMRLGEVDFTRLTTDNVRIAFLLRLDSRLCVGAEWRITVMESGHSIYFIFRNPRTFTGEASQEDLSTYRSDPRPYSTQAVAIVHPPKSPTLKLDALSVQMPLLDSTHEIYGSHYCKPPDENMHWWSSEKALRRAIRHVYLAYSDTEYRNNRLNQPINDPDDVATQVIVTITCPTDYRFLEPDIDDLFRILNGPDIRTSGYVLPTLTDLDKSSLV